MRKADYQHYAPEQVRAHLAEALAIVEELELDDELRGLAFAKAVDLLAAKQMFFEQAQLGVPGLVMPQAH
jgi:hypothetical protein